MKPISLCVIVCLLALAAIPASGTEPTAAFPEQRPNNANVNKPYDGAVLAVSPPGFCWWRAADYKQVNYRVFVYTAEGEAYFVSAPVPDPVFIPDHVFPAGEYTWIVKAYDIHTDKELASRQMSSFTIEEDAYPLPMPDVAKLLSEVSTTYPRLLFQEKELPSLRKSLKTTRKNIFDQILTKAESGLSKPLVPDPVFHLITDRKQLSQKRTDYRAEFHAFRDTYLEAVEPMAFVYMITREKKYGEAAKKHLLRLTELPIEGSLEIYDSRFDEIPLQIADALPRAYDWAYDMFSEQEKAVMENWMVSLADSLLRRMDGDKRDFFFYSGESHDGRIPPYLMNFAIVLSHRPEAKAWLDFAIKASLSVYPQWGTEDGGWAEGISYALSYSGRFVPPLEALYKNTGFNLWHRPFYRNFPYFLTYSISPVGEITPFGDMEDRGIGGSQAAMIHSMLRFYSIRNNDPEMRWWVDLFQYNPEDVDNSMKGLIQDLMFTEDISPKKPENIKQERIFHGIGWSVMHSDIVEPEENLMLLFKSSPFGSESHSHLDQNSFAIMKGGKALAIQAGSRYPQHGSPFHSRYTRQTLAHNTILVNGQGQIDKNPNANGRIFASAATAHIAYSAGEAHNAYGAPVTRFDRHVVMIRPALIIIFDDIELSEEGHIDWLLHGKEAFVLNENQQSLLSVREDKSMKLHFVASQHLAFHQDNVWPVDPKEDYPMVTTRDPEKQWHFKASTRENVQKIRIATIMTIGDECSVEIKDNGYIKASFSDQSGASIRINVTNERKNLARVRYFAKDGSEESVIIKEKPISN